MPSAVIANEAGTPSWVWPPRTGAPYAFAAARTPASTRAAEARSRAPSASSRPTGVAPIADRSLTLTSTPHHPAHSGSRSTIEGRIASQAATRSDPGTGAPSSPTQPAPPGASPVNSAPRSRLVADTSAAIRPIGHRITVCGRPATVTGRTVSHPSRRNIPAARCCTVASNRSTPAFSA